MVNNPVKTQNLLEKNDIPVSQFWRASFYLFVIHIFDLLQSTESTVWHRGSERGNTSEAVGVQVGVRNKIISWSFIFYSYTFSLEHQLWVSLNRGFACFVHPVSMCRCIYVVFLSSPSYHFKKAKMLGDEQPSEEGQMNDLDKDTPADLETETLDVGITDWQNLKTTQMEILLI